VGSSSRAFDANRDVKIEASEGAAGRYVLRTKGLADRKRAELEIADVPEAGLNAAAGVINILAAYSVNEAEVVAGQSVGNVLTIGDNARKLLLAVRAVTSEKPKGGLWSKLAGGGKGVLRLVDAHADASDHGAPLTALATMLVHRAAVRLGKDDEAGARAELEAAFYEALGSGELEHGRRVLWLGRDSWRLRDDDNLYLRAVEQEAERALAEITSRIARRPAATIPAREALAQVALSLAGLDATSVDSNRPEPLVAEPGVTPRQLLGQPAAPGVGRGIARVARTADEVRELRRGEVLVVDALEPDTAAFAARAAAIVERRGGMLVHGAIVAREHGVPAVTGVTDATNVIRSGQHLTVDGFLGIVVLDDV